MGKKSVGTAARFKIESLELLLRASRFSYGRWGKGREVRDEVGRRPAQASTFSTGGETSERLQGRSVAWAL
ncbi:hypothetical protein CCMA1212_008947 [Trichoderma ghanense]|uniref:Uncharacterized protein n=1 Tax=Trichoderma ghanense TaxID=65468 RepID=A0ABY2GVF2_9HYPO